LSDFPEYLRRILKTFESQRAMADAVGITPQRLSRAMAGSGDFPLNVENCLRLAKAANRPPREVLEAAGKREIAELIDFLYPRAGRPTITGEQKQLLDDWSLLDDDERKGIRLLIHGRVVERKRKQA
jgi:transcriptional regulator with XRE-family HTH domain